MKKLKYILIGCGRITKNHIKALLDNKEFYEVIAVSDPVRERAENIAKEIELNLGVKVKTYENYKELLKDLKPDVAAIATESGYHPDIALDCLSMGINVIVEKPMALSVEDCDKMINLAKEKKLKGTVCFQNRFNPPIQKLKKAIDMHKFGQILHGQISIRWNRNAEYYDQAKWRCTWALDGGALMNQCSHGIDLLQWTLGGNVKSVYGVLRKYGSPREAEDFGSAIVEFDNGAVGIIEGTVNVYPKNLEEKLSVFGEKGTVVIGGLAVNHLETWNFENENLKEERIDPPNVYGHGHSPLYKDFYEAVTEGREPYISLSDGKKAVEIILAVYQSMKTGEKISFPHNFSSIEMNEVNLRNISGK